MSQIFPIKPATPIQPDYTPIEIPGIKPGDIFDFYKTVSYMQNLELEKNKLMSGVLKDMRTDINGMKVLPRYIPDVEAKLKEYGVHDAMQKADSPDGVLKLQKAYNALLMDPVIGKVVQESLLYEKQNKALLENAKSLGSAGLQKAGARLRELATGYNPETKTYISPDDNFFNFNLGDYFEGLKKEEEYAANQEQRAVKQDLREDAEAELNKKKFDLEKEKFAEDKLTGAANREALKADTEYKRAQTSPAWRTEKGRRVMLDAIKTKEYHSAFEAIMDKNPEMGSAIFDCLRAGGTLEDCRRAYDDEVALREANKAAASVTGRTNNAWQKDPRSGELFNNSVDIPVPVGDMTYSMYNSQDASKSKTLNLFKINAAKHYEFDAEISAVVGQGGNKIMSPDLPFYIAMPNGDKVEISKAYKIQKDIDARIGGKREFTFGDLSPKQKSRFEMGSPIHGFTPFKFIKDRGVIYDAIMSGKSGNNVQVDESNIDAIQMAYERMYVDNDAVITVRSDGSRVIKDKEGKEHELYFKWVHDDTDVMDKERNSIMGGRIVTNDPSLLLGNVINEETGKVHPYAKIKVSLDADGQSLVYSVDNIVIDLNNADPLAAGTEGNNYRLLTHDYIRNRYGVKTGAIKGSSDVMYEEYNKLISSNVNAKEIDNFIKQPDSMATVEAMKNKRYLLNLNNLKPAANDYKTIKEYNILSDRRLTTDLDAVLTQEAKLAGLSSGFQFRITDMDRPNPGSNHSRKKALDIGIDDPMNVLSLMQRIGDPTSQIRQYLIDNNIEILLEYCPDDSPEIKNQMRAWAKEAGFSMVRAYENGHATGPHLHFELPKNSAYMPVIAPGSGESSAGDVVTQQSRSATVNGKTNAIIKSGSAEKPDTMIIEKDSDDVTLGFGE